MRSKEDERFCESDNQQSSWIIRKTMDDNSGERLIFIYGKAALDSKDVRAGNHHSLAWLGGRGVPRASQRG
jgi:hypothetical protein